jgi:putative Mg2+ transporter-C (MgtC) family protein
MTPAAFASLDAQSLLDSFVSLATAFLIGTAIGAEREFRQRSMGLRINVLVAVGAAAFVDVGMRLDGDGGAVRVLAYVVSGVGFLGAGVIMKEGMNIRGLNTAATLWGSAAAGGAAGGDLIGDALLIAVFVILSNTALRPLVNAINRQPLSERSTEALYELLVTAHPADMAPVRERVMEELSARSYAVRETRTEEVGEAVAQLTVVLAGTTAKSADLEAVIATVEQAAGVRHASWSMRTSS